MGRVGYTCQLFGEFSSSDKIWTCACAKCCQYPEHTIKIKIQIDVYLVVTLGHDEDPIGMLAATMPSPRSLEPHYNSNLLHGLPDQFSLSKRGTKKVFMRDLDTTEEKGDSPSEPWAAIDESPFSESSLITFSILPGPAQLELTSTK